MELPEEVMKEAERKASLNNKKVVIRAFVEHYIEQKHGFNKRLHEGKTNGDLINGYCQCDYCTNLRKYVEDKMAHHRLKKLIHNDTYPLSNSELDQLFNRLAELEDDIAYYKSEKDKVKRELKL